MEFSVRHYFQQQTGEWYIANPEFSGGQLYPAGTRRPYRFGGRYSSRALFAEGAYGITVRLEAGAQFPYFDQRLADATRPEPPAEAGFGDLRLWLRWKMLNAPAVLTLKAAVKAPTGRFRNEDGLIPVGEGQWDFDLVAQFGRSLSCPDTRNWSWDCASRWAGRITLPGSNGSWAWRPPSNEPAV
ncbi:MAG: hypothetical protein HYW07_06705 [Candidatus Latescibacteria bacterium]|nr:hypothetical protein [Candidatus Latescibacterota bacterium]